MSHIFCARNLVISLFTQWSKYSTVISNAWDEIIKLFCSSVPADQCEDTCHHAGTTRQENYSYRIPAQAIAALAGFAVGKEYYVPWAQVEVPQELQKLIFPFCEDVIVSLQYRGCTNKSTFNFLNLLKALRPFFWRVCGSLLLLKIIATKQVYYRPSLRLIPSLKALQLSRDWPSCPTKKTRNSYMTGHPSFKMRNQRDPSLSL